MPRRLRPYVIRDNGAGWRWPRSRYSAVSLHGYSLFAPDAPDVSGASFDDVRRKMAREHPEYVEQRELFPMGGVTHAREQGW